MPRLEHLGIAVADRTAAETLYRKLFGFVPYKVETVEREGVRTSFLDAGAKLELLESLGPDSPVGKFLDKRGEGLHHLAFEVDDIHAEHARLQAEGFRLLHDAPKPGADGKLIFFIHPKDTHGVLVELCQSRPFRLPAPTMVPVGEDALATYAHGNAAGPTLLILHGAMGSTALETARLFPFLEKDFRLIGVDLAGHGRSTDFAGPLTIDGFRENVIAVMDHYGLKTADVFGFSLGGVVALLTSSRHPNRVRRVAAHGANIFWTDADARLMVEHLRPNVLEAANPHWARRLAETHGADRWKRLAERTITYTQDLPDRHPEPSDLANVAAPALVSGGDRDRYFPPERLLRLHAGLPDSRLALLPDLDHPIQGMDLPLYSHLLKQHFLR